MGRPATCNCGTCHKCVRRVYMRDWYARNVDTARETARRSRLRRLEAVREYDRQRGFRVYDAEKVRVRRVVRDALLRGELVRQPCEVCATTPAEAHHDDYSRPLDVRWLCRRHHGEVHRSVAA